MIVGSCLCGAIQYAISGTVGPIVHCHCSMCRKATGAAFRTRASVSAADFRWVRGEESLARYESSPGNIRTFCSVCGSTLVTEFPSTPEVLALPLGTVDTDLAVQADCHVFVASKPPWFSIGDSLPQHTALPRSQEFRRYGPGA